MPIITGMKPIRITADWKNTGEILRNLVKERQIKRIKIDDTPIAGVCKVCGMPIAEIDTYHWDETIGGPYGEFSDLVCFDCYSNCSRSS